MLFTSERTSQHAWAKSTIHQCGIYWTCTSNILRRVSFLMSTSVFTGYRVNSIIYWKMSCYIAVNLRSVWVFRCLSNDIELKGLFLYNCVVFSLLCVAIVIFEPVFERAYFGTDFAAIRRNKFTARYFWFKAKLKQKKFILR